MNAKEWWARLKEDRKLALMLALLALGGALIALSFLLPSESGAEPQGADIGYASTSLENRLAAVLSRIAGAGQVEVLVTEDEEGICGVLVVAEGAQELTVRTELMRAAMTALDVPADAVEVFAGNDAEGA